MVTIKIQRIKRLFECGGGQALNIFIDGNKAGSINQGETKIISVPQGIHSVYVEQLYCISNSLVIDAQKTKNNEIEVGSRIYGWKIIFAIYFILAPVNLFYARISSDGAIH